MGLAGGNKQVKYAAVIGSLAVLGVMLSPVSPLSQMSSPRPSQAGVLEKPPQPENISDQQVLDCTSLIQGVEYVIAGGRLQPVQDEPPARDAQGVQQVPFNITSDEKLASDVLLGETCNRPEIVQNISGAYDPTIMLVAYGCEVASGLAGDEAMKDSISDYKGIYCSSSIETIQFELDNWKDSVSLFETDVIPAAREQFAGDSNRTALIDEAQSAVSEASSSFSTAQDLLDSGAIYGAAKELDRGINTFTSLVDREDMSALFDI